MHKILIKGYFKNCEINEKIEYNTIGFLVGNIIRFTTNNTNIQINNKKDKIIFTKEDINTKLTYEFIQNKKSIGKYNLKKEKIAVDIPIYTIKSRINNKSVNIEFCNIDNKKNKNSLYIEYEVLI